LQLEQLVRVFIQLTPDDAGDGGGSDDDRIMNLMHKPDVNQIKIERELWRTGRLHNLHGLRRIHSAVALPVRYNALSHLCPFIVQLHVVYSNIYNGKAPQILFDR
jgi:hypothetical protein